MVCGDSWSNDLNVFRCHEQFTPAPPIKRGSHNRPIAGYNSRQMQNFRKRCQDRLLYVCRRKTQSATLYDPLKGRKSKMHHPS